MVVVVVVVVVKLKLKEKLEGKRDSSNPKNGCREEYLPPTLFPMSVNA